ncbi:MAG: response regulator [Sediminicola sp.]
MEKFAINSVLLVDDDEASIFLNKIFIRKLGLDAKVYTALNGREALDFLDEVSITLKGEDSFGPCLLILDINMPILDGWGFLDAYAQRFSEEMKEHIVIVMITVSEDERDLIRASNNPMIKEYLQKPLSDEHLLMIMQRYFPFDGNIYRDED